MKSKPSTNQAVLTRMKNPINPPASRLYENFKFQLISHAGGTNGVVKLGLITIMMRLPFLNI